MRQEPSSAVPDVLLVERMVLLRDEEAAVDLFERHSVLSFDPSSQSVASWLSALTRRRAHELLAQRSLASSVS